jgi:hypothetical protein
MLSTGAGDGVLIGCGSGMHDESVAGEQVCGLSVTAPVLASAFSGDLVACFGVL